MLLWWHHLLCGAHSPTVIYAIFYCEFDICIAQINSAFSWWFSLKPNPHTQTMRKVYAKQNLSVNYLRMITFLSLFSLFSCWLCRHEEKNKKIKIVHAILAKWHFHFCCRCSGLVNKKPHSRFKSFAWCLCNVVANLWSFVRFFFHRSTKKETLFAFMVAFVIRGFFLLLLLLLLLSVRMIKIIFNYANLSH